VIHFEGKAGRSSLRLDEIAEYVPFRVPWEEKGKAGRLFHLDTP
jgi:hypothetical protein